MSSRPIYVPPDKGQYGGIDPAGYAELTSRLKANLHVTAFSQEGPNGSASMQGVDVTWTYDDSNIVTITIVKKHGFAKFVPNQTIFDEIHDALNSSEFQPPPVSDPLV